jgi:hypothetical protein
MVANLLMDKDEELARREKARIDAKAAAIAARNRAR